MHEMGAGASMGAAHAVVRTLLGKIKRSAFRLLLLPAQQAMPVQ